METSYEGLHEVNLTIADPHFRKTSPLNSRVDNHNKFSMPNHVNTLFSVGHYKTSNFIREVLLPVTCVSTQANRKNL